MIHCDICGKERASVVSILINGTGYNHDLCKDCIEKIRAAINAVLHPTPEAK